MKADRIVSLLIGLLLAALFAVAVIIAGQYAAGMAWFSAVAASWPIVICWLGGVAANFSDSRTLRVALGPVTVLGAAALMYLLTWPAHGTAELLVLALAAAAGVFMYLMGLRGDQPYPTKLSVLGIGAFLVECVILIGGGRLAAGQSVTLSVLTLASFVLTMYSFNAVSVSTGLHNAGSSAMRAPAGLRGKNLLMLTAFLAVAILIGCIGPLQKLLSSLFGYIIIGISAISRWISGLSSSDSASAAPTPTPTQEVSEKDTLPEIAVVPALRVAFIVFMIIILLGCVVLVLALIFGKRVDAEKGGGRRRSGFWDRFFRRRKTDEYDDSVERILDLRGFIAKRRKAMGDFFEKLTRRPQKLDDMPDDRARLRFAYWSYLRSPAGRDTARSSTPLENAAAQSVESLSGLARDYSAVRYDDEYTPGPEQVETARRAMGDMKRRTRKPKA